MGSAFKLPSFHLGPMSLCTVNAALAVAARRRMPLCLIASRRQIDAGALGGGYVNGWSTEEFAAYVRARDPQKLITLARDHGGPYQRDEEKSLSPRGAMVAANRSFEADMMAGFKILHLDPEKAVERGSPGALQQFTDLTIELMLAADSFAKSNKITDVTFEIGTDEGAAEDFSLADWTEFAAQVMAAARRTGTNLPVTFAVPMGTKVKEMRNVGGLVAGGAGVQAKWVDHIHGLQSLAKSHGLTLKLHNGDYLSAEQVSYFTASGVNCINVAPEFGVVETRALLDVLRTNGLAHFAEEFLEIAHGSGKWERWLVPNSTASDEEKSIIAGHYVFAAPEVVALRAAAQKVLATKGLNLDALLQSEIEKTIEHYLNAMEISDAAQRAA
jgi:hypothetical protein